MCPYYCKSCKNNKDVIFAGDFNIDRLWINEKKYCKQIFCLAYK